MSGENVVSTLNGLFKEIYAGQLNNVIPDGVKLSKEIKFTEAEKIGNFYHQPAILSMEHGMTYLAAGAGVTTLNSAVAATLKDAQIQGSQGIFRAAMDYEAAAKAAEGGKRAFVKATELLVQNMVNSVAKRKEITTFYGQSGIGQIDSVAVNGSYIDITIKTDHFASGLWAGMENAPLDSYAGASKINTNAALVIVAVDIENKKVTVSGNASDRAALAADQDLYFYGSYGQEFLGLDKVITTAGTLFNIDNSTYGLFKGNTFDAGSAALSLSKIQSAVAVAVGKGLEEDVQCLVSPKTWANLISNEAALRKYDASYKSAKMENAAQSLMFHSSNGGIEVVPSIYIKEGISYIVPVKRMKYIGATDVTFNLPGRGDEFFLHIPDRNSFELRAYYNLALYCERPSYLVKVTNIVNS